MNSPAHGQASHHGNRGADQGRDEIGEGTTHDDGRARHRQRTETVDEAGGQVDGEPDGRTLSGAAHVHREDAGDEVITVAAMPGEADGAAEHVAEQENKDQRQNGDVQHLLRGGGDPRQRAPGQHPHVAERPAQAVQPARTPHLQGRPGQAGLGNATVIQIRRAANQGAHAATGRVSEANTSSREGCRTAMSSTSIPASSSIRTISVTSPGRGTTGMSSPRCPASRRTGPAA